MNEPLTSIENAIKKIFGNKYVIINKKSVGGGCINQTSILTLNNTRLFIKENFNADKDLFKAEFNGLKSLRAANWPRDPEPYYYQNTKNGQFLLFEYIISIFLSSIQ